MKQHNNKVIPTTVVCYNRNLQIDTLVTRPVYLRNNRGIGSMRKWTRGLRTHRTISKTYVCEKLCVHPNPYASAKVPNRFPRFTGLWIGNDLYINYTDSERWKDNPDGNWPARGTEYKSHTCARFTCVNLAFGTIQWKRDTMFNRNYIKTVPTAYKHW